jgi:hypothetical protein
VEEYSQSPKVPDPEDPADRKSVETVIYAKFKMGVYQHVLSVIFACLKTRSWNEEPFECWDKHVRVFHPGILIESLDGKEAVYFNACCAALANHPCPRCLVHKCDLHFLTKNFKLRTPARMKEIVQRALGATTKKDKEEILKKNGLHGIKVYDLLYHSTRLTRAGSALFVGIPFFRPLRGIFL